MSHARSSPGLSRDQITALILCGGRSRRMGLDKAQLERGGQTLLGKTARTLEEVAATVWLACGSEARYQDLGYPLVLDEEPGRGPLEGLRAGLERLQDEWLLAVACDMPALACELFAPLLSAAVEAHVDLVYYGGEDGNEPLCALYRRTVLPAVRASLEDGRHRMDSFWSGRRADGSPLVVRALAKHPDWVGNESPFQNVNTPEDLAHSSWTHPSSEERA